MSVIATSGMPRAVEHKGFWAIARAARNFQKPKMIPERGPQTVLYLEHLGTQLGQLSNSYGGLVFGPSVHV